MKLLAAFFRLVRWPNLVFIALTQYLFYSCIINFFAAGTTPVIPQKYFWLLSLSSVLVAAAGNIINDYFDLNIDRINKPDKLIIGKIISRRWAMLWHVVISFAGIVIGFYVGWKIFQSEKWLIGLANLICVGLLVFYSTTFKKQLLIGNVIISLLTAWVVFIVTVVLKQVGSAHVTTLIFTYSDYLRILKFTFLYGGFAFIISLIREAVKDIEDIQGDAKYNCKTMPIVWGIPVAKVFVAVWIVVLIGALGTIEFYVLQIGWWISAVYCLLFVILPLFWVLKKLYAAHTTQHYHQLSAVIKLIMLAGIVSMLLIKIG